MSLYVAGLSLRASLRAPFRRPPSPGPSAR